MLESGVKNPAARTVRRAPTARTKIETSARYVLSPWRKRRSNGTFSSAAIPAAGGGLAQKRISTAAGRGAGGRYHSPPRGGFASGSDSELRVRPNARGSSGVGGFGPAEGAGTFSRIGRSRR